ncbi:hypothetical protein EPN95_01170 [Patescibacteria group bacterium]|nr:MAG: hypothetical protein EPN95_01170 [Patescibacteria group bacterium]
MIESEYAANVKCPATGEPCEKLVQLREMYTSNHDQPEVTEAMRQDDLGKLSRAITGYGAVRSCELVDQAS